MRIVLLILFLTLAACASPFTSRTIRTAGEADAYRAYDVCWRAGGPPTLDFVAIEEAGRLYGVMSHSFGSSISRQKYDAITACMARHGATFTYGFPPSMMGTGRR